MNIKDIIPQHFPSKAAIARQFGITRQAVTNWGDEVPEIYRLRLQYEVIPNLNPLAASPSAGLHTPTS